MNRSTARRQKLADKDEALRSRMKILADQRKRFGAPRLHILLQQEGLVINHKRTERIYSEEHLALRKRKSKKQAASARKQPELPKRPEVCWAMDFVHDNLEDGRAIRILSIVDIWDRTCPMLTVEFSQTGQRVINTLEALKAHGRLPQTLRMDNGPEFTCKALQSWAARNGITIDYTRPGKPTDNGHVESFNGRLRDECLNQHIFANLDEARSKIEAWRQDYNFVRPHSALGWLTPAAYRERNNHNQLEANLKVV